MHKHQAGAAVIEFALVAVVFLTVLLGLLDFGRMLYFWNAAGEATRAGARKAVVCSNTLGNGGQVLSEMQQFLPLTQANVQVQWYDTHNQISQNCSPVYVSDLSVCAGVSVSVVNMTFTPLTPVGWIGFSSVTMPPFQTYLPREIMGQDTNSGSVC